MVDTKLKRILQFLSVGLLSFCAVSMLFLTLNLFTVEAYASGYYIGKYWISGYWYYSDATGFEVIFGGHVSSSVVYILCISLFVLGCLAFVVGLTSLILYIAIMKCTLEVTEKNVIGKTFFGKKVILPIYMISAYSTRKFLSTISIATSSGITKFSLIKNYLEIGNVLSGKINERQDNTSISTTATTPTTHEASQGNSIDDLKKLKDFLDAGIITQEEFDAKKKQLLGL